MIRKIRFSADWRRTQSGNEISENAFQRNHYLRPEAGVSSEVPVRSQHRWVLL